MYTIGEFAAFGRVSVRMLRHYDALGHEPVTGTDELSVHVSYLAEPEPNREVYLHAVGHTPGPDWITELQVPVERT